MKNMRYFIPLLLFLIIAVFLWQGLQKDPHQLPSALINKPVPAFNAPSLLHAGKITQQQFRSHVSLLNVWATWCVTCRAEHAILVSIANSHAVKIYGLNYKDDPVAAKQWLNQYGNPYEDVILDDKGTVAIDLGVYGTPESFVIDKQGIIRFKYIGAITAAAWQEKIEPEIKKWQDP